MKLTHSKTSLIENKSIRDALPLIACGIGLLAISIYLSARLMGAYTRSSEDSLLGTSSQSHSALASVSVGIYRFSLTGYSSPFAKIILEGQGLYEETSADTNGKFTFSNRFSPLSDREVCLTAVDTNGRASATFCLPPFPTDKNVALGPVIMPPTITLNQDIYSLNDFGVSSGKAVPLSKVDIALASAGQERPIELSTQSNADGDYSMTLPTQKNNSYELTAHNSFETLESTKSTHLSFSILPLWLLLIRYCMKLLFFVRLFALPLIIVCELLLLAWLYKRSRSSSQRVKQA